MKNDSASSSRSSRANSHPQEIPVCMRTETEFGSAAPTLTHTQPATTVLTGCQASRGMARRPLLPSYGTR
jgi:hypothetical protein